MALSAVLIALPLSTQGSDLLTGWIVGALVNTLLLAIAWKLPKKLLTPAGYGHAWALGVIIWGCLGWRGYVVMMAYFLAGTAVTRLGKGRKEAAGIAEGRSGVRGPENVWGSALAAAVCAGAIAILSATTSPASQALWLPLLGLAYVSSLSTKLSDTTASEVGKAYGRSTFLITSLKPVPAGTEGAVSLEGTLAGVAGSLAMALVGWAVGLITLWGILICLVAAFIATTLESLIGATLQTRIPWLTNEVVNGINTTIGAVVGLLLGLAVAQIY
ncbi:TIGR00297 family protein [Leptolyngbya sp. CCNP1308]|uniref:TIGR00297 family protein n=1 Tax=Leptolyngbya sp. CCNP1308 TaxID=3110255 RepID=UPI002B220729|nr:TIGR00297 family protein [Leptolyngbya sp. CCNP1308]MEA5452740.1 TIGR00297 family protein [Leptolyngbya sp. CCNP1308]